MAEKIENKMIRKENILIINKLVVLQKSPFLYKPELES